MLVQFTYKENTNNLLDKLVGQSKFTQRMLSTGKCCVGSILTQILMVYQEGENVKFELKIS